MQWKVTSLKGLAKVRLDCGFSDPTRLVHNANKAVVNPARQNSGVPCKVMSPLQSLPRRLLHAQSLRKALPWVLQASGGKDQMRSNRVIHL